MGLLRYREYSQAMGEQGMDDRIRSVMEEVLSEVEEVWDGPMRDPARIDALLSKIREIWMRDPDMRFGQLVYNLFWQMQDARKEGITGLDMFYVEDDSFERRLDEVIREGWQSPK